MAEQLKPRGEIVALQPHIHTFIPRMSLSRRCLLPPPAIWSMPRKWSSVSPQQAHLFGPDIWAEFLFDELFGGEALKAKGRPCEWIAPLTMRTLWDVPL